MGVNLLITDRKVYNQYGNGLAFALNLGEFATYLRGGVMNVQKVVYEVEIDWSAQAVSTTGVLFATNGNQLTRNTGSWIADGFSIGDTIDFLGSAPAGSFSGRTITNITDTLLIFDGAAEPVVIYTAAFLLGGKTDLFALEYSFGIIENNDPASYQSLLDGSDQTFYADGIGLGGPRSTAFVDMIPKSPIRSWMTSRPSATRVKFVSRPSTYVQRFEIEHEYIIVPYNDADFLTGNLSFKYVSKLDFRTSLPNLNTAKVHEDDIQLGSVGYFDENYDGYANDFTISDLVYTDVATASAVTELNIKSRTRVEFSVASAAGNFTVADPFVLFHSFLPEVDEYSDQTDDFRDIWIFESARHTIDTAPVTVGILKELKAVFVNANQIDVTFEVELTAAQQLRLDAGDDYVIAIELGDGDTASQPFNVTLAIDFDQYSKDANIPDLMIADVFGFNPYNLFIAPTVDLFSTYKGWIEDEIVSFFRFGVNRTAPKDAEILSARFKIVAYEDATGETFDLQNEELDLSGQLAAPPGTINANPWTIQLIDDDRKRNYRLPDGDEFNLLLLETDDNDGTYQYYEWRIGMKMNWQTWIALPGANNIFIITSEPFNNKNNRASNYSLKNGWSIRVQWQFDMKGIDDESVVGETEYNFFTDAFEILDFGDQDGDPTVWDCEIFTFDENAVNLGGLVLDKNENTFIKAIFTPTAPFTIGAAADYWGELRIAEQNQPGFDNDIISTTKPQLAGNKLIPLPSDTFAKLTKVGNTLELEAQIDVTKLVEGTPYKLSAELRLTDSVPIELFTFTTESDIPADGTFDPGMTSSGGEVPTWTLIAGYNQNTLMFSKGDRIGLDVSELDGSCQDVDVTFSTNDPTNIDTINMNNDQICQTMDLSLFTEVTNFTFNQNNITGVTFPTSSALMTSLLFFENAIAGTIDLSPFSNLGGAIQIYENSGLTGITLPGSTQLITVFSFHTCDLTGAFDLSNLDLSGIIRLYNNANLTGVTFPSTTNTFTNIWIYNTGLTGTLDMSPISNLAGSIQLNDNSALTDVTFPSSASLITEIDVRNSDITGTFDLTNLTNLSGELSLNQNDNMTGITLPSIPNIVTITNISANDLTGTIDISNITKMKTSLFATGNSNMTGLTLPATNEVMATMNMQNNDLGYVDLSVLTATNDNISIRLDNNNMTAAEVNCILEDLDNTGWIDGTINIAGSNSAPDGSSGGCDGDAAKANLIVNGWTVTTN